MWVAQHNALHDKLTKWGKDLILSLCECCAVFSHLVQENLLQKIAASDEYEVVRQVQESYACKSVGRSLPWCAFPYTSQELYASFVPVDPSLFSLEISFGMNYSPSDVRQIPKALQTIYFMKNDPRCTSWTEIITRNRSCRWRHQFVAIKLKVETCYPLSAKVRLVLSQLRNFRLRHFLSSWRGTLHAFQLISVSACSGGNPSLGVYPGVTHDCLTPNKPLFLIQL